MCKTPRRTRHTSPSLPTYCFCEGHIAHVRQPNGGVSTSQSPILYYPCVRRTSMYLFSLFNRISWEPLCTCHYLYTTHAHICIQPTCTHSHTIHTQAYNQHIWQSTRLTSIDVWQVHNHHNICISWSMDYNELGKIYASVTLKQFCCQIFSWFFDP